MTCSLKVIQLIINSPLCWLPAQQYMGRDWERNEDHIHDQTKDDTKGWHLRVQQKEMKGRTETQVLSVASSKELTISKDGAGDCGLPPW